MTVEHAMKVLPRMFFDEGLVSVGKRSMEVGFLLIGKRLGEARVPLM